MTESSAGQFVPFVLFRVKNRLCALPLANVVETMRPLPVDAVSGVPAFVTGLSVVRGAPVPVVDMVRLLDGTPGSPGRFLTVRAGLRQVALAVDEVIGVRSLSSDVLADLPSLLGTDAIAAIGARDGELLLLLEAGRVVSEDVLGDLAARAEGA